MGLNDCHRLALPPTVLIPMTCVQITEKSLSNEAALTPSRSGAFAGSSELPLEPGPHPTVVAAVAQTVPPSPSARVEVCCRPSLGTCNLARESAI